MRIFLLGLIFSTQAFAESHLLGVTLQMCDDQARCLQMKSKVAEISNDQSVYAMKDPQVSGMGFDGKDISSAYIDFASKQILLRERKNGVIIGEWSVQMNHYAVAFFGR